MTARARSAMCVDSGSLRRVKEVSDCLCGVYMICFRGRGRTNAHGFLISVRGYILRPCHVPSHSVKAPATGSTIIDIAWTSSGDEVRADRLFCGSFTLVICYSIVSFYEPPRMNIRPGRIHQRRSIRDSIPVVHVAKCCPCHLRTLRPCRIHRPFPHFLPRIPNG
jgi:hypothetical protein